MQTFVAGGLDKALLQRVRGILEEQRTPGAPLPRIILTGHSLGGALAVLAAHELQRELGLPSEHLSVYTFGAPRTGNHAYAAEYAAAVPDTWHTINNQVGGWVCVCVDGWVCVCVGGWVVCSPRATCARNTWLQGCPTPHALGPHCTAGARLLRCPDSPVGR
jgi:hypothetical protein